MGEWEVALIAIALSMDAFAAGLTDGMTAPRMPMSEKLAIAFAFGLFQFLMPVLGYYASAAFSSAVARVAPWLSFALLALIGGKSVIGYFAERKEGGFLRPSRGGTAAGKIFAQAVATSLDALAAGVAMLAAETSEGLPFPFLLCALYIGITTFLFSAAAVEAGGRVGDRFHGGELVGGAILILIGLKILLEGVL